ncbi:hypothetical protein NMY22_g16825 [Coprinellus aureogranulatus]|nr:hypothetical protein NMY22_g16825 [Coprinellus aureogranulatus]
MPTWQVPHCTGSNRSRPLFNPRGGRSDPSYILCKSKKTVGPPDDVGGNEVVTMFAGLVEGIRSSDEFALYQFAPLLGEESRRPFGKMLAVRVGATSTVLQRFPGSQHPTRIPQAFYTKRIGFSDAPISIFCDDEELLHTKSIRSSDVVDDQAAASLILTVEEGVIYFERNDTVINAHAPNLKRLPCGLERNEKEKIDHVVNSWRHFDHHLRREPTQEYIFPGMGHIRIELHYLEGVNGLTNDPTVEHRPSGENLLAMDPALIHVTEQHGGMPLGFTLYNDGDVDVYPYLFYFDPIQLTIIPWSLVAAGQGTVDPPLPAHSRLAVGYGDGGALPFYLTLEGGKTEDIGFFKLFITCSPANLRCISQEDCPFDWGHRAGDAASEDPEESAKRAFEELEKMQAKRWGVKVATVIQRKC